MDFPEMKIGDLVCRIPIVQGGMGVGISMAGLASAVANEGGVGVIAAAMIGVDEPDVTADPVGANVRALKREIRKARSLTGGIIGVNIMVALTHYSDLVRAAVEEKVDLIFSGAGMPMDLPSYRGPEDKTRLVPIVSSGRAAKLICQKWLAKYSCLPDAFVLEGSRAGGHLGFKPEQIDDPAFSLDRLLREVLDAISPFAEKQGREIPVIVAGGVYTGEDIYRYLLMGASGVQMGTRFVATHECDADTAFKETYIDAKPEDLIIITSPVGMPGRALRNAFLEDVSAGNKKPFTCPYHCVKTCDRAKSPYCIALALAAAKKGKFRNGFAFAGANAYRVDRILSVPELIDSLRQEYLTCCRN